MNKQCVQCNKSFKIFDEDQEFYAAIQVPEPTHCPDCRNQRRLTFRQERVLYPDTCQLCKSTILSAYSPDAGYVIYCHDCWWSDNWNPLDYGRDYDFSRSFFEQFGELLKAVPRVATVGAHNDNCQYVNYVNYSKDSYLIYGCNEAERCMYSWRIHHSVDSVDSTQVTNGELCYYAIDVEDCYNTHFSYQCKGCSDSAFLYDCQSSRNCFLSSNLRNAEYVFKNKQLTQSEYERAVKEYDLGSYTAQRKAWEEFKALISNKAIHKGVNFIRTENSTGDHLVNCNTVHKSYNVIKADNARYCYYGEDLKDSVDATFSGWPGELVYETLSGGVNCYNVKFSIVCWSCVDAEYSDNCHHSNNLFAAAAIRNGKYVILNKQYSKQEYITLRNNIIAHMRETGEYGEFFPSELSPFAYNETMANEFYPITREAAIKRGWNWQDNLPGTTGKETLHEIPDSITDVDDSIINDVLVCAECSRNYKIVPQELAFYKKAQLAVPQLCPNCRHTERMNLRNPLHLWQRQCMCTQVDHGHNGLCTNQFETTYSPERKEIVYCQDCYKKVMY